MLSRASNDPAIKFILFNLNPSILTILTNTPTYHFLVKTEENYDRSAQGWSQVNLGSLLENTVEGSRLFWTGAGRINLKHSVGLKKRLTTCLNHTCAAAH